MPSHTTQTHCIRTFVHPEVCSPGGLFTRDFCHENPGEQMSGVTTVWVNKCPGGNSTGKQMSAPGKNPGEQMSGIPNTYGRW